MVCWGACEQEALLAVQLRCFYFLQDNAENAYILWDKSREHLAKWPNVRVFTSRGETVSVTSETEHVRRIAASKTHDARIYDKKRD